MSIKDAVKYWEASGEGIMNPETGEIIMPSVETISRAMRRYGCHPDQLRAASPAVRMRTEYPNQAWQADASVCVLYRIPGSDKIGLVKEKSYNGKKPENLFKIRQNRIVRYLEVDHYSGNFYLRYEQAPAVRYFESPRTMSCSSFSRYGAVSVIFCFFLFLLSLLSVWSSTMPPQAQSTLPLESST